MTATPILWPLVRKEFRALLPFWLATLATMAVTGLPGFLLHPGVLAYMLGTITLGAFAIGHEYSSGTLAQLLAQPASRVRILLTKLAVLSTMLVALAAGAMLLMQAAVRADGFPPFGHGWAWTLVVLSLVGGLTVAPWLTMCCRNAMAGVVFTIAIPAALWIVAEAIDAARNGWRGVEADNTLPMLWVGSLIAGAIGAVLGSRMFLRLEAIESQGELAWPGPAHSRGRDRARVPHMPAPRHRHPIQLLAIKELRLQAVSFVFAALYVLVRIALWLSGVEPDVTASFSNGITTLHFLLMSVLLGSLASAEERAFGTREWQALQPLAYRTQWAIKVGVTVTLALLLALALPFALDRISPPAAFQTRLHVGPLPMAVEVGSLSMPLAAVVVTLVACGLYVSSLCTGGLRALLATFPFVAVGAALTGTIGIAASNAVWTGLDMNAAFRAASMQKPPTLTMVDLWWYRLASSWLMAGFAAGLIGVLLWLAASNHRSSEHGTTLLKRQIGWLGAYAATASLAMGAGPFLFLWILALR